MPGLTYSTYKTQIAEMAVVAADDPNFLAILPMMLNYAELLKIPEIIVGMIVIGAIGFVLNELLLMAERYLFKWRWQVTL